MSILIQNGKIFTEGKLEEKNILIQNGKIKEITSDNPKAEKTIDAKDKIVLPGLIDCHVHFREPGLTHKGDFLTESRSAAKGGVTSIIDMPNTIPPTTTLSLLDQKRGLASKSIVNFGFHFGSKEGNIQEVRNAKNIASVKLYMDFTTGDLKIDDHSYIVNLLKATDVISVHAEEQNIKFLTEIADKEKTTNKLYFCHISSENELKEAKKFKNSFIEVTPHHLLMTKKDVQTLGHLAEMKPPLRTEKDRKFLWKAIEKGLVDTIGTDHAPHTLQEKERANYSFGVPGVETMLPLLLNEFNKKNITLNKIVELCCENPAKIFRIKNKGFIKEKFDADLVIIDPNLEKEVLRKELVTKCKWSPFEGKKLKGWPVLTIVNGHVIYDNGKINEIKAEEIQYER